MAKLLPINQWFDAAGLPLASGKVYTYITGTSTAKTTWTDSTGTVALPNPVILGSNGRKEIWLDTDQAYRLIIKDSSGTQIGATIDNVLPTTSFSSLAGGQNIDVTGYAVITTANGDLALSPNGTGQVKISGMKVPNTAGSATQVITSDGTNWVWGNAGVSGLGVIPGIVLTSPVNGDLFKYNGSNWINSAQSTLAITASQVTDLPTSVTNFANKTGNISQWTNDIAYATATSATAFTNKTGAISQWTNDIAYSTTSAASASDQQAASNTTKFVAPATMVNHPGVPKAVFQFTVRNTDGTCTITSGSYGVTSVTRRGADYYDIVFSTAFADTNYMLFSTMTYANGTINGSQSFVSDGNYDVGSFLTTTKCTGKLFRAGVGETNIVINVSVFGKQ